MRGKGRRGTAQRRAVHDALAETPGFASAAELYDHLNNGQRRVSMSTLYRHLNALADSGAVDIISAPRGQLFRHCASGYHHHHLVCENCGKALEITPPDQSWLQAAADQHGFTLTRHVFEAFGLCARARSRPRLQACPLLTKAHHDVERNGSAITT